VTTVHLLVPDDIRDPMRPSGGNSYDRRICDGLPALGWEVREHAVGGSWPRPDESALAGLAQQVAAVPDGALLAVDGLIASAAAAVLVPASRRLRLVVLVHMPLPDGVAAESTERAVLTSACVVITTSSWARSWLLDRYRLDPGRVQAVRPGADPTGPVPGTPSGDRFLCVAAVVPHKGHDVLLQALSGLAAHSWRCILVGSLDRDPAFVRHLRRCAAASGIADKVRFAGPRTDDEHRRSYAGADLLVLPSRFETYGMVLTEALAAGLPVIASAVGGVPEAVGRVRSGVPGLLVPPGDAQALGGALAKWLGSAGLRRHLRRIAGERRATLEGWETTIARVASALASADEPAVASRRVPG
jgi:glycosyltransferase involved in cell wall biosynthesis